MGLYAWRVEAGFAWLLVILAATLLPLVSIAIPLVNSLVTRLSSPSLLPKLDFSTGVPANSRTMIVVPALLTSESEVDELLQQAEQHYLGSINPYIDVGLLTDFADAPEATMPEDEGFVALHGKESRCSINATGTTRISPSTSFTVNGAEIRQRMLGWVGNANAETGRVQSPVARGSSYVLHAVRGSIETLSDIRYVITLDADTELPPGERPTPYRCVVTSAQPR